MHVVNENKINKIVLIFPNKYCYSFYFFCILFIKKNNFIKNGSKTKSKTKVNNKGNKIYYELKIKNKAT